MAQSAGADLLIVVYNESKVFTIPDLRVNETTPVTISVMLISNDSNVSGEILSVSSLVHWTMYHAEKKEIHVHNIMWDISEFCDSDSTSQEKGSGNIVYCWLLW